MSAANGQVNYKNLLACGLARGVAFSALALAVAPFIFTAPVYAADDNTVSIAVDQNAALQPAGTLYKATTNVTVKTGKPYGFNLTMQADTADLINSKDSTHKISATPSSTPVALNVNQWGYSLNKSASTFSAVPAGAQATPAVVADVTKAKPAGCTNPASCTKSVTFAANIDPVKLASGSYSTKIIYTVIAKPEPDKPTPKYTTNSCAAGYPYNDCDISRPVLYDYTPIIWGDRGWWVSKKYFSDDSYNYSNGKWAIAAITTENDYRVHDKYSKSGVFLDQKDVRAIVAYVPRFYVKNNSEIRFCSGKTFYGCDYNEGRGQYSGIFHGDWAQGFWINLSDLGCDTVRAKESYVNVVDAMDSTHDQLEAYKLAKFLVDAIGSPCPKRK